MSEKTTQMPAKGASWSDRPATATIIVYDGDEIGALHGLSKEETIIGRTPDCDIVLVDSQVSRRHAAIRRCADDPTHFELVDLDSTNGTIHGGHPVQRARLQNGDKFVIGDSTLKFALLDQADLSYQARIIEMIHVDEVTGLLTKRSLYRALEKELLRAARYDRPLTVLMMDLDYFKQVNDTHGHLVGSHCLAEVGRLIRETTRAVDVNGRYGGEEFVSFLPETDGEHGLAVAERIRQAFESATFCYNGRQYEITISIGVSVFPDHGRDIESLVHRADLALYRAKDLGRNRCELYDESLAGVR